MILVGHQEAIDAELRKHAAQANPRLVVRHASETRLLEPLRDEWTVQRLAWFSKGFYGVREADAGLRVIVLPGNRGSHSPSVALPGGRAIVAKL